MHSGRFLAKIARGLGLIDLLNVDKGLFDATECNRCCSFELKQIKTFGFFFLINVCYDLQNLCPRRYVSSVGFLSNSSESMIIGSGSKLFSLMCCHKSEISLYVSPGGISPGGS